MRCSASSASSHCCSAASHTSVLLYTLAVRRALRRQMIATSALDAIV